MTEEQQVYQSKEEDSCPVDLPEGKAGRAFDFQCICISVLPKLWENQYGKEGGGSAHTFLKEETASCKVKEKPQKEQDASLENPPVLADVTALLVEEFQAGEGAFFFVFAEGYACLFYGFL